MFCTLSLSHRGDEGVVHTGVTWGWCHCYDRSGVVFCTPSLCHTGGEVGVVALL